MTAPITKSHRLSVARAWEGSDDLSVFIQRWVAGEPPGWVNVEDVIAQLDRLSQLVADAEGDGEWIRHSDNPAVPLLGDVCWVQFDDHTVGSKPHVWVGGLQPWRVNGNIQRAPILAYQLLKAPKPPEPT